MNRKRVAIIAAIVAATVAAITLLTIFAKGNERKTGTSATTAESGTLLPEGNTGSGSETAQAETPPTASDPQVGEDLTEEAVSSELTGHSEQTGHTFKKETLKEATCTEDGTVRYVCTGCDYAIEQTVKATGHTVVIDAAKEPTCQHTGLSEGSHCAVCGQTLKARETLPAVSHNYQNGICIWCGKAQTESSDLPPMPGENELEINWMN